MHVSLFDVNTHPVEAAKKVILNLISRQGKVRSI